METLYTIEELKGFIALLKKRMEVEEGFDDTADITRYEIMHLDAISAVIAAERERLVNPQVEEVTVENV